MKNLTDKELIDLANAYETDEDYEVWDLRYYQQTFLIVSGNYKLSTSHLYYHYKNWSNNPVGVEQFLEILSIEKKSKNDLYIDKNLININITKLIGEYVTEQKKEEKEKRFRKISSIKSKIKCKD